MINWNPPQLSNQSFRGEAGRVPDRTEVLHAVKDMESEVMTRDQRARKVSIQALYMAAPELAIVFSVLYSKDFLHHDVRRSRQRYCGFEDGQHVSCII